MNIEDVLEDGFAPFLASMGFNPDMSPVKTKLPKRSCPECQGENAYVKEFNPDTSYNEMGLFCPDCQKRVHAPDGEEIVIYPTKLEVVGMLDIDVMEILATHSPRRVL